MATLKTTELVKGSTGIEYFFTEYLGFCQPLYDKTMKT